METNSELFSISTLDVGSLNRFDFKNITKNITLAVLLLITPAYADEPPSPTADGTKDAAQGNDTDPAIAPVHSSMISRILSTPERPLQTPSEFLRRLGRHEIALSIFHGTTDYMLQDIARLEDTKSRRLREKRTEALLKRLNGYVQDLKLLQADFEEILRMKDTITEGKNPEETQRLTELLEAAERRFRSLEERQQTPAATTDQADPEKNTPLAENLRESTSQRLRQKAQQIIESQNEEDQQIALDEMREELERIKIWSRTRHDE